MPTKLNRAGQQQNYIPEGHGDASGEYGDNATGSNVHVKIERKDEPDTTKRDATGRIIPPKHGEDTTEAKTEPKKDGGKAHEQVASYVDTHSTFTKEQKSFLSDFVSKADSDCNEVLAKALDKGDYKFSRGSSCFIVGGKVVYVASNSLTEDVGSYVVGGEFYHECGHLIDWENGKGIYTGSYYSRRPASASFISEKYNITLNDMVKQEGKTLSKAYSDFMQEKEAFREKYLSAVGYDEDKLREIDTEYEDYRKQEREIRETPTPGWEDVMQDYFSGKLTYEQFTEKREVVNKIKNEKLDALEKKYEDLFKTRQQIAGIKRSADMAFNRKYGDISDMLDASTKGRQNLGMMHGRRYWSKTDYQQGVEFFAETFQAKAVNPESFEVIKKYFPKSVEIFEEILRSAK